MQQKSPEAIASKRAALVQQLGTHVFEAQPAQSFEEALHALALQVRIAVGAHQCAISYVPLGEIDSAIHTHSLSEKYEQYNTFDVVPTGQGIWNLVLHSKQGVRMAADELAAHPKWTNFGGVKDARGLDHPPMRGWLAAPILRASGELLGVLQLSDKFDDAEFAAADLDLLMHLANMVLPTFELHFVNQQLERRTDELRQSRDELDRRVQERTTELTQANEALRTEIQRRQWSDEELRLRLAELTILHQVGKVCAAARTEDEVLSSATAVIAESLYPDNCGFLILDESRGMLVTHPSFVITEPGVSLAEKPVGTGITGQVALTGQPRRIGDVSRDPHYLSADDRTRSELCLPLWIGGKVGGVLNVESQRWNAFSELDEQLASTIVGFVGNTLERLRAGKALGESEERLRMAQAAGRIGSFDWCMAMNVAQCSEEYFRVLGLPPRNTQVVTYDEWVSWLHPDDREQILANLNEAIRSGEEYAADGRIVRPDGSVRWMSNRGRIYRDAAGQPVRMLGTVQDITARKLAEEAIRDREARLLEIAAEEQRRIGQELHDGAGQELTGLTLFAGTLVDLLQQAPRTNGQAADCWQLAEADLRQMRQTAARLLQGLDAANRHVHALSHGIMPVQIDAEGLRSALEELAAATDDQRHVACRFECSGPVAVVENTTATHLFRIAQEALNNALRHSRANQIGISLSQPNGQIILEVTDNGVGIDPAVQSQPAGASRGMGLRTMSYRAGMIGGKLKIDRLPAGGTRVQCSLPQRAGGRT